VESRFLGEKLVSHPYQKGGKGETKLSGTVDTCSTITLYFVFFCSGESVFGQPEASAPSSSADQ